MISGRSSLKIQRHLLLGCGSVTSEFLLMKQNKFLFVKLIDGGLHQLCSTGLCIWVFGQWKMMQIYGTQNLARKRPLHWQGVMRLRECNRYYLLWPADKNTVIKWFLVLVSKRGDPQEVTKYFSIFFLLPTLIKCCRYIIQV